MATIRRLTTILAVDAVGYSRLMGTDEEGTHGRLKAHFQQLIDPKVLQHRGRLVKNTGDGALVEFASVVDAVRCAAEIQRGMIGRELGIPEERRIKLRMGVNLGDVIVEPHDIFGDGVNVAARLEALAEPGGICVSGTVHDEVRNRLPYPFDNLGERSVKNILRPIRVYALTADAIAALPKDAVATTRPPVRSPRRRPLWSVGAATLIGALVVTGALWWLPSATRENVATSAPLVAPRLSIVVLPFSNLSDDPKQQYFADGVTEDLTTDLSRIANMFVISADTAFTYRDKPLNTKQIGRELGVRYMLEGSIQRTGNQVRINAQLINTETDRHLWADRFDREMGDLFDLQDEITTQIAAALDVALISSEANRPTEHPDALDYIFRGRAALRAAPGTRDTFAKAVSLFDRALALDPHSPEALSRLAITLTDRTVTGLSDDWNADIGRAEGLIEQAMVLASQYPLAHFAKGHLLRAKARCREAIPQYEAVLASNRNSVSTLTDLGLCKTIAGQFDEGRTLEERAIRLMPRGLQSGFPYFIIGQSYLFQSRTDEAIAWLEKATSMDPELPVRHMRLAAAYALKGEANRATAELAEARRVSGNPNWLPSIAAARTIWRAFFDDYPELRTLVESTYFAGLRKAGLPEEDPKR